MGVKSSKPHIEYWARLDDVDLSKNPMNIIKPDGSLEKSMMDIPKLYSEACSCERHEDVYAELLSDIKRHERSVGNKYEILHLQFKIMQLAEKFERYKVLFPNMHIFWGENEYTRKEARDLIYGLQKRIVNIRFRKNILLKEEILPMVYRVQIPFEIFEVKRKLLEFYELPEEKIFTEQIVNFLNHHIPLELGKEGISYKDRILMLEEKPSVVVIDTPNSEKKQDANPVLVDELTCVICLERKRDFFFYPCQHFCTCAKCGSMVQFCPICLRNIDLPLKVYM